MTTIVPLAKKRGESQAMVAVEATEMKTPRYQWSGNFDPRELGKPGGFLVSALVATAYERGQQLNDMARELGVTYGYINQLRNGVRPVNAISEVFSQACALYLGTPRLTVLMLAGQITAKDAFEEPNLLESEIPRAMKFICEDPEWGALVPQGVRTGDFEQQFLVIRLYEEATDRKLLPERLDVRRFAEEMKKLNEWRQARAVELSMLTDGVEE